MFLPYIIGGYLGYTGCLCIKLHKFMQYKEEYLKRHGYEKIEEKKFSKRNIKRYAKLLLYALCPVYNLKTHVLLSLRNFDAICSDLEEQYIEEGLIYLNNNEQVYTDSIIVDDIEIVLGEEQQTERSENERSEFEEFIKAQEEFLKMINEILVNPHGHDAEFHDCSQEKKNEDVIIDAEFVELVADDIEKMKKLS